MTPARIAILTVADTTWAFPTWAQTIPLLAEHHQVVGVYLFPDRLGKMQGQEAVLWYGRTFGWFNFLILAAFAVKRRLGQLVSSTRSWKSLIRKHGLQLCYGKTPNAPEVSEWIIRNDIDVVFIMVPHILKGEILNAPKVGIINKHAGVLPCCKGVFPYIWALLEGLPTGVSFHKVDAGIDTGQLLAQRLHPEPQGSTLSFLQFYTDVYDTMYAPMAIEALERLLQGETQPSFWDGAPSYFGFPTRDDLQRYLQHYRIAAVADLLYQPEKK